MESKYFERRTCSTYKLSVSYLYGKACACVKYIVPFFYIICISFNVRLYSILTDSDSCWHQFYHACDGDRIDKFVYCMTKYSVLATGDFLASTVSLWITLIAMAQIPMNISSAVQMAGPLALIIGVLLDRHSLWVIAVPTGVGLLVVAASWVSGLDEV